MYNVILEFGSCDINTILINLFNEKEKKCDDR